MGTLDEVKNMQAQGMQENQIINTLQERGVSYREISEALSQSKIKSAVETPVSDPNSMQAPSPLPETKMTREVPPAHTPESMPGMQQSIMQSSQPLTSGEPQEYFPTPEQPQAYTGDYDSGYDEYGSYGYGGGISPDTITEISEQVVSERLSEIRQHIENIIDFKTTIEGKTESIEERLKKIEKIIDTLHTSILRKVGDYGTSMEDIKKELLQTQKTFTKLVPELRKHRRSVHKSSKRKKK